MESGKILFRNCFGLEFDFGKFLTKFNATFKKYSLILANSAGFSDVASEFVKIEQ